MEMNAVNRLTRTIILLSCILLAFPSNTLLARQNNIAITIERTQADQISPKIISAGSTGGTLIFWVDGRDDKKSLYMQTMDENGTPAVSGGSPVLKRTLEIVVYDVAITQDGGIYIAWQEATSRVNNAFLTYFKVDGAAWQQPVQLGSNSRHQLNPYVRIDDSDGAYVVWEDRPTLSFPILAGQAIIAQHFDKNGKTLWKDSGIDVVRQSTVQNLGDVLAVKDALVVAWENTRDNKTYMRTFMAENGNAFTDEGFMPSNTGAQMARPKLALAENKNDRKNTDIFVVWEESGSSTKKIDLHAQKIDLTGEKKWGSDGRSVNTEEGDQFNHEILDDGSENLFVVWQDGRDAKAKIYAQKLNSSGSKRFRNSGIALTDGDGDGNQINPKIAANGDNGIYCAWEDDRNGTKDIYAQEVKSGGALGWKTNGDNGVPVAIHPGGQANAGVFMHPDKRFVIVWEDKRNGDIDLYAQTILENGNLDNVQPAITSVPDSTARTGQQYTYQVQAIDYDKDLPLAFSLLEAPDWMKIDASTGLISGIAAANSDADQVQVKIEIQVEDDRGAKGTQSFVLTIEINNHAPRITSQPVISVNEDETYLYQITFEDADAGDSHTFIGEKLPSWLNLAAGTGLLSGTPTNDDVGEVQVAVRVQDQNGASTLQEFTLTVINTNDPPFFTSTPDTIAYVDAPYQYQVQVSDIDVDDVLTVKYLLGPDWASWDVSDHILSGTPAASSRGEVKQVLLEVADVAGVQVIQRYILHVMDSGTDSLAPDSPAVLFYTPPGWVSDKNITLHWQTPSDRSGVKTAFVKIGVLPVDKNDFDLRHEVDAAAGVEDSVSFSIAQEGIVPVYLWFEDRAGNVDVSKSASLVLKVDRTSPSRPVAVFPNARSREDTVRFVWRRAMDTGSGIKDYSITIDPRIFKGIVSPVAVDSDQLEATLVLNLDGRVNKIFSWSVTATDSANNQATSDVLSFALDATLPLIIHAPLDTISVSQNLTLLANVTDQLSGIASVQVWYRTAGMLSRQVRVLPRSIGDNYSITIPGTEVRAPGFEYVLIAADSAGNKRFYQTNNDSSIFRSVVIRNNNLVAPNATRENTYQIVSVPFSVPGFALRSFFETNFGVYNDKLWRLIRWQEPTGYLELPSPDLESLRPGRAYWLITRKPLAWKTGVAHSISTAQKYEIPLKPGWNMIATPFAFDTDWRAVPLPDSVQPVLWDFTGSGYQMEQATLKSWRGYFIQNNSTSEQILHIAPVQATSTVQKVVSIWDEADWVLQIKAAYQDLQDAANFIGVAGTASDEYDRLDFSEPPAIGTTPRLFFVHDDWLEQSNAFATDFRNTQTGDLTWNFVIENLSPGGLRLSLEGIKFWPDNLTGILYDETTATKKSISIGDNAIFHIEPGETRRQFRLKFVRQEEVNTEINIPKDTEIYASWPNPYERQSGKNVVFRFALEKPSDVELRIFNILGQEIYRSILSGELPAGEHALTWNGRSLFNEPVASGLYFVSIIVNNIKRLQQKIVVIE